MADINDFNYVYILDLSDSTICEIILTNDNRNMEIEDLLEHYGCDSNTCSFMYTVNRIYGISTLDDGNIKSENEDW